MTTLEMEAVVQPVDYEIVPKAKINWKHPQGPLLICSDETWHFLTLQEKLLLRIGVYNLDKLDRMYNHEPTRG